jgi:hypothetical protein
MDVVITTRLHGTVLALKNGVPAIAIDPIPGGTKIRRQAETIGWPVVLTLDALTDTALRKALTYCLTEAGRQTSRECAQRATKMVEGVRDAFVAALKDPLEVDRKYLNRTAGSIDREWMSAFAQYEAAPVQPSTSACGRRSLVERFQGYLRRINGDSGG